MNLTLLPVFGSLDVRNFKSVSDSRTDSYGEKMPTPFLLNKTHS